MVELHAWATIRESYDPENEEDNLDEIILQLHKFCEKMQWVDLLKIEYYNGVPCLTVALYKNRIVQEVKEVFELFLFIAKIAIGSYGLIYMWDDEDKEGQENSFQVYRLARGKFEKKEDIFLSPAIPVIEDEPKL